MHYSRGFAPKHTTIEIDRNLFIEKFINYIPLYTEEWDYIERKKTITTVTFSMERAKCFSSRPQSTHAIILEVSNSVVC